MRSEDSYVVRIRNGSARIRREAARPWLHWPVNRIRRIPRRVHLFSEELGCRVPVRPHVRLVAADEQPALVMRRATALRLRLLNQPRIYMVDGDHAADDALPAVDRVELRVPADFDGEDLVWENVLQEREGVLYPSYWVDTPRGRARVAAIWAGDQPLLLGRISTDTRFHLLFDQ